MQRNFLLASQQKEKRRFLEKIFSSSTLVAHSNLGNLGVEAFSAWHFLFSLQWSDGWSRFFLATVAILFYANSPNDPGYFSETLLLGILEVTILPQAIRLCGPADIPGMIVSS